MTTLSYKVYEHRVHAASFVLLSSLTLNSTTMAFSNSILDRGQRSILKTPFQRPSHSRVFYPTFVIDEQLIKKYSKRTPQSRSTDRFPASQAHKEVFRVKEDFENVEESDQSETKSSGVRVRKISEILFQFTID